MGESFFLIERENQMDQIILKDISFFGRHGVFPEEKKNGQIFQMDIILDVDLQSASKSDKLNQTVDYSKVYELAVTALTKNSFDLIEKAAGFVCDIIIEKFDLVSSTSVTIKKPQAPMPQFIIEEGKPKPSLDYAAVTIKRERLK